MTIATLSGLLKATLIYPAHKAFIAMKMTYMKKIIIPVHWGYSITIMVISGQGKAE
jgi:hypothetical protein